MDQLKMQKMRDLVLEELRKLDTSYKPSSETVAARRYTSYHEAAALLSTFEIDWIKPAGPVTEGDNIEELLADSCITYDAQRRQRWTILPEVRRAVIQQLGSRQALIRALEANTERPDDTLQQMLEAYLFDDAPPMPSQSIQQLTCALQIIDWFKGVEGFTKGLPGETEVRARIEMLHLLEPFEKLAGEHFRGRVKELDQLRNYVGVVAPTSVGGVLGHIKNQVRKFRSLDEKPPLMIYGPGGMGKSTLIAKFILEHAKLSQYERFPFAYIDFDRPGLLAEEPTTLLVEAVRQIGIQYPDVQESCHRVRLRWQQELATATRHFQKRKSSAPARSGVLSRSRREKFLVDFHNLLETMGLQREPFLMVLDTFEEVQCRAQVNLEELWRFLDEVQYRVPRLRTVLSGRAMLSDYETEPLQLSNLDEQAAQGFLEAQGVKPQSLIKTIVKITKGNPLSLKLAVKVFRKEGTASEDFFRRLTRERLQGELYERILSHIDDENVRLLAHPGFILRRITPELILHVLAGPCGVVVKDLAQAQKLFEDLGREITLVVPGEDGALRHQPEVRLVMIDLLRADEEKIDQVRQIQESAIAHYERLGDPVSRAEEIYHRLSLHQDYNHIAGRWIEGVEHHLYNAVEELNPAAQAFLAPRLGIPLEESILEQASQEDWEMAVENLVIDALQMNDPAKALKALSQRTERLAGSRLYLLEAEIYEQQGNWHAVQNVLARARATGPAPGQPASPLKELLLQARACRHLGQYVAADESLYRAREITPPSNLSHQLQIGMESLRLKRSVGKAVPEEARKVRELFEQIPDEELAEQADTVREIVGEFGLEHPSILLRALRLVGLDTATPTQKRALARAIAEWDLKLSVESNAESGILARSAGVPAQGETLDAWANFVQSASPKSVTEALSSILASHDVPASVCAALVDILRLPEAGASPETAGGQEADSSGTSKKSADPVENYSRRNPASTPAHLKLTTQQRTSLVYALLDAFPTRNDLQQLLRFRLDIDLDTISFTDDMKNTAALIVQAADRMGWLARLIAAARESNPGNKGLLTFSREIGLVSDSELETNELERLLRSANSFIDVDHWRACIGEIEGRICRVEIEGPDGTNPCGTGFLVGPDQLLTAFHVMEEVINKSIEPGRVALRFDYKQLPDGTVINPGTIYRLTPDTWLMDYSSFDHRQTMNERKNGPPDYALLRLEGAPGREPIGGDRAEPGAPPRGWITTPPTPKKHARGESLLIVYYPRGEPLKLSTGSILDVDENGTRVYYDAQTEPGSSGAPCFDINWELVAIHQGMRSASDEPGAPFYNTGTQVSAIVRLARQHEKSSRLGGDFFESTLLRGGRVFLDRKRLRESLRRLAAPNGPRVLLVDGPPGSGKTYTREFIFDLVANIPSNKAIYVQLDAFDFSPSDLAIAISRQMGLEPASMPGRGVQQMAREIAQLSDWIIAEIIKSNTINWWFIFDGFEASAQRPEILDFIKELMFRAGRVASQLRVVLLGHCDDPTLLHSPDVLRETLAAIRRTDVMEFFTELRNIRGQPYSTEQIEYIVDEIWQETDQKLGDRPDKEIARLPYLNRAVYSAVKALFELE